MKDAEEQALRRLAELESLIEEHKALYAERDLITLMLQKAGFERAELDGKTFEMQDNFAKTNVCYRAAFVRRFNVKVGEK